MAAGRPPQAVSLQPRKQGTRQATGVSSQTTCSGAQSRGVNIVVGAGMELGGPAGAAQRRAPVLGRRSRDAPRFTPKRRGVPNFSPHLTTKLDQRVGEYAAANNLELAYVPTNASWLDRIEPQFTGLRYFALDGTDHQSHAEQGHMIRRYISWRNRNTCDRELRRVIDRANVC